MNFQVPHLVRPADVILLAERNACQQYLAKYHERIWQGKAEQTCQIEDLVVHVGDRPNSQSGKKGWTCWSAAGMQLPTIRRSSGLYIAVGQGRQVTCEELYTAMGFPALQLAWDRPWMIHKRPYNVWPSDWNYYDAKRALGNSMHVSSVGCVMAALLTTSKFHPAN